MQQADKILPQFFQQFFAGSSRTSAFFQSVCKISRPHRERKSTEGDNSRLPHGARIRIAHGKRCGENCRAVQKRGTRPVKRRRIKKRAEKRGAQRANGKGTYTDGAHKLLGFAHPTCGKREQRRKGKSTDAGGTRRRKILFKHEKSPDTLLLKSIRGG